MKKNYTLTRFACYLGYSTQAMVNNFLPLLYVMFSTVYGVNLSLLALVGAFNFIVQLAVDLLSASFVDKIGYRASGLLAQGMALFGFVLLFLLPRIMDPFIGILISVFFYALGGGLDEVIISPLVESCPCENKKRQMGILHSMYCFSAAGVILISTIFIILFGIENWYFLALFLCLIPIADLILFIVCPIDIPKAVPKKEIKEKKPISFLHFAFVLLLVMILMAGATEQGIAQWASTFAELSLGVQKPYGDLFGACLFALTMGLARIIYSLISDRFKLKHIVMVSSLIALVGYLLASLSSVAFLNFFGCMLVGAGVGALWPASMSLASEKYPDGGTPMFSFLAFAGDVGCGLGTYLIGFLSEQLTLSTSILIGCSFPVLFFVAALWFALKKK